jgi:hypothetical protein
VPDRRLHDPLLDRLDRPQRAKVGQPALVLAPQRLVERRLDLLAVDAERVLAHAEQQSRRHLDGLQLEALKALLAHLR